MKRGLRNGVAPYIPAAFCRDQGAQATARQRRRDRNGRCKPGVSRQGWKPVRRRQLSLAPFTISPPRQGDARKRHKQENNKTGSNQSSRKKKNSSSSSSSSRNNHIISNRQMTGLKRQKPTAERPRNERGGA
ncbi:putative yddA (plasmid) [Escherichia coli]|nr:putative yddA [Escherichia coli]